MSVAPLPLVIDSSKPFGAMCNQAVANLKKAINDLYQVQAAAAAAESSWVAHLNPADGTVFEVAGNLFGVVADASNPGNQGTSFQYQVNTVKGALDTFMSAAGGAITALDQGTIAT